MIQERSFNGLSNLRDLHLEHNKLKRIDVYSFGKLNKLETLLLDHNELEEIEGLFVGLSNLKDLHLEHNQLKTIKRSSFEHLKSIKLIRLDDTKFKVFFRFWTKTIKNIIIDTRIDWKRLDLLPIGFLFWTNFKRPLKIFIL